MLRIFSSLKEIMQVENPGFYLYMFRLISTRNRMTINRLVYNGYIGYNELLSEIMELFYHLYETPIECSIFCHVLNSYLSRYLQRVIHKYHRLTPSVSNSDSWVLVRPYGYVYRMPVKVETNSVLPEKNVCSSNNSADGLLNSNLHVLDKRVLDNPKDSSLPREIPIIVDANECDVSFLPNKKNNDTVSDVSFLPNKKNNDTVSDVSFLPNKKSNDTVSDLQSFLLPLQQDHTKSSKGYSCQSKCDKTELENAVNLFSNNNFQNNEEPIDNNDFNTSDDDEYYDPAQNLIISRYLNSLNNSSSESEVSYSEICCDSDSDNSVVFTDSMVENTQGTVVSNQYGAGASKKIELNVSFSCDSDSDDSIEFVEMFDNKYGKSSKGYKYTYENDNDSEICNSDLLEKFDNISFSLHKKFDLSFRKSDFSDSSFSLTQSKMTVYSTDFEGFSNPGFEDDDVSSQVNLKNINDKWENSMQAISCEPRQPKRVSFVPFPDLVSVQIFEPDDDNYRYSIFVLDQIRFRNRIQEFEEVIKPYLSPDHRAKVYQCYNSSND